MVAVSFLAMRRRHATEKVIWELAAFLGKRDWLVGPATPPPAVCMAGRWAMSSAFVMIFVDGTARGSGDPDALLDHWSGAIESELGRFHKGEFSHALATFFAVCFCDLPEPLASDVLGCKRIRVFSATHGFCRAIDLGEGTLREHAGVPFFCGHGAADIRDFLVQWREFAATG